MSEPEVSVVLKKDGEYHNYTGGQGRRRTVKVNRVFDVFVNGEHAGTVEYRMATRERRTEGRTYVDKRWLCPAWFSNPDKAHRGFGSRGNWETTSKKAAVADIVEYHLTH